MSLVTTSQRDNFKEKVKNILRENREFCSTELMRSALFGEEDNEWLMFCQHKVIGWIIRKIRMETGLYIFYTSNDGMKGYRIAQTQEDFDFLLDRARTALQTISDRITILKREKNNSVYWQKVEKFFK